VLAILDTNVVSRIHEVAMRGYDAARPDHQKVLHLVEWLVARQESRALSLFGVVEGAGFHAGGLSMLGVVGRTGAVAGTLRWAMRDLDRLKSGQPMPSTEFRVLTDADFDVAVDTLEDLMPMTVLASYVATLAIAQADRMADATPVDRARWVHDRLVRELDFIPLVAWMATVLLFCGKPALANRLRTSFFKLEARDRRRACLSAAWDLGYLQLMSLLRTPQLAPGFGNLPPVIVTEEKRLPELASLVTAESNSGTFSLAVDQLAPAWADAAGAMLEELAAARMLVEPRHQTWESTSAAAARLQEELGFGDVPELHLPRPARRVTASLEDIQAFFSSLRIADRARAIDQLVATTRSDHYLGGISLVAGLLLDNASVRQRDLEASWEAVASSMPEEVRELDSVNNALFSVHAIATESDVRFNAAIERIGRSPELYGYVILGLWMFGRAVLDDTARARETTVDAVVETIAARIEAA
jgi:hypothetical protein